MSTTTTKRDLSTIDAVIKFLEEALGELGSEYFVDYATSYGEPGYSLGSGATPLVVLGYYWCRCDNYEDEYNVDLPLHSISVHYPDEWETMEENGVEFEWYDEWVVVHEEGAAYRTSPDSYSWTPSVIADGEHGIWLTPNTADEDWFAWASNNPDYCIPEAMLDDWPADDWKQYEGDFQAGLHEGMDSKPADIYAEILEATPEGTEVIFVLTEGSQFYITFTAYYRLPEQD